MQYSVVGAVECSRVQYATRRCLRVQEGVSTGRVWKERTKERERESRRERVEERDPSGLQWTRGGLKVGLESGTREWD